MIIGAHAILYSKDAEADRAFLRDVFAFPSVDAGEGWLIFGLPPSEVAVHPGEKNDVHELYLMCDDVAAFVATARQKGAACGPVLNRGWGLLTELTLPGGGKLGVYQPRHARPLAAVTAERSTGARGRRPARTRPARRKAAKKPAARKPARTTRSRRKR